MTLPATSPASPHGTVAMTPSSDRDLLFALLAFQTGLVARQQLAEAAHAREDGAPLGEALVRSGAIDAGDRAALEALAARHAARQGGERAAAAALRVEQGV